MLCPLLRRGRRRREGAADRAPPFADRRPPLGRRAPPPLRGAPRPPRARGRSRLDPAPSPGTPGRIGTHPARSRHPCVTGTRVPLVMGRSIVPPRGLQKRWRGGGVDRHAERDPRRPRPAPPRAVLRDQPGTRLSGRAGALREPAQRLLAAAARGGLHAPAVDAGRAVARARRRCGRHERRAPNDAGLVGPPRRGLRRQRGAAGAARDRLRAGVARVRRQGGVPRVVQGASRSSASKTGRSARTRDSSCCRRPHPRTRRFRGRSGSAGSRSSRARACPSRDPPRARSCSIVATASSSTGSSSRETRASGSRPAVRSKTASRSKTRFAASSRKSCS